MPEATEQQIKGCYVTRKNAEKQILDEYVVTNYPKCLQWTRVRVGAIPEGKELKFYGCIRRWADAIVYDGKTVTIIEAKMRPDPAGLAQLELYARLFPKTPEFQLFKDAKIKLIYLTVVDDPEVRALAATKKIRVVVYRPKWVVDLLEQRAARSGRRDNDTGTKQ